MTEGDHKLADTLKIKISDSSYKLLSKTSVSCLAIIWHTDLDRIGEVAPLYFGNRKASSVSRLDPDFFARSRVDGLPLADRYLSRTPLKIEQLSERTFLFTPPDKKVPIEINGRTLDLPTVFDLDELGNDIVITLSECVVLSLFNTDARLLREETDQDFGLLGASKGMAQTRDAIRQLSKANFAVLIRGETGTGKELVARGLHQASHRNGKEMISVNMATIMPSLAAAELFGVKKGAFTGANSDKAGLFEQADHGTLFLDEIGDAPEEVQPMLLRVIECGEFRRVGDDRMGKADVRVIAATDRKLEPNERSSFNQPLLKRLETIVIELPPLRHRRSDFGILLCYFLLEKDDTFPRFDPSSLSAADITKLCLLDWPGNVRELHNVAVRLRYGQEVVIENQGLERTEDQSSDEPSEKRHYGDPSAISDQRLLDALDKNDWVIKATAQFLNLSRTSLYDRMKSCQQIRKIDEISDEELRVTFDQVTGSYGEWAKALRVGREALRKRTKRMGH